MKKICTALLVVALVAAIVVSYAHGYSIVPTVEIDDTGGCVPTLPWDCNILRWCGWDDIIWKC